MAVSMDSMGKVIPYTIITRPISKCLKLRLIAKRLKYSQATGYSAIVRQ